MVKVLDHTRPFGEVRGDPMVAFVQDERMFDHLGNEIVKKKSASSGKKCSPIQSLPKKN